MQVPPTSAYFTYLQVNNNAKASAMQCCLSTHLYTIIYNMNCKKHDDFGWSPCQTYYPWHKIPKEKNTKINDDDFIT
jgi:hypothetical protein